MTAWVIYDEQSGAGKRFFHGNETQVGWQLADGEAYIEVPDTIMPGATKPDYLSVANGDVTDNGPPLSRVRSDKVAELTAACDRAIVGGFTSSALGSAGSYGSQIHDQLNILHALVAGGDLKVGDADGTWTLTAHTAAQAQQVQVDFIAMCTAARAKLDDLLARVADAATIDAVEDIDWDAAS